MRIGIDARISYYNNSGLSRYLLGLIRSLALLPHQDELVLLQNWRQRTCIVTDKKVKFYRLYTPPHARWEGITLPFESHSKKMDLLHCIDFYAPFPASVPLIFTAQDLYFLHCPESMSRDSFRFYKKFLTRVQHAAHVVCSSHSTRRDLLAHATIASERTSVVYPGMIPARVAGSASEIEALQNKLNLSSAPILMVGTIEPRKNIPNSLQAYSLLRTRLGSDCPPLLLVGRRGYAASEILDGNLADGVRYLGEVSETQLRMLYSLAAVVLYPSHYEGFGFPILEGFASDTPVITSKGSSMEEVAADAALLVDPDQPESIASALEQVLSDTVLASSLVQRGRSRLDHFTWEATATTMRDVYASVTNMQ